MTDIEFKNNVLPYSRKLYPMLKRILKSEDETRDAVQELMLKLWNKRHELEKCHHQQAYIFTMAKNYSFDILKKKKPLSLEDGKYEYLEAEDMNPEVNEKYEHVQRIIANLPDKYKEVIRMRDIDGLSFEEINAVTGLEVTNIRVILSRARQKVKEEIEKIYNYEDKRQVTGEIL